MSIEKLLDKVGMGKNAVTYLLKNALAEGSEEITSDAVNWLADVMISQDKSEWQETLFHYQVMGFSEDEAFLAAMKEQGRKMLKDGAAGAITGAITAGGRLAGGKISDGIQNYKNYREVVQNGRQYYALNQLTQGNLARSLGNMNVEQSYRSMSPEAILEASGLKPQQAQYLLENTAYSPESRAARPSADQVYSMLRASGLNHQETQALMKSKGYSMEERNKIYSTPLEKGNNMSGEDSAAFMKKEEHTETLDPSEPMELVTQANQNFTALEKDQQEAYNKFAEEIHDLIRLEYPLEVHKDKQGKHVRGSFNFDPTRGELTADPKELIQLYAGKGKPRQTNKGEWCQKEYFVHTSVIGIYKNLDGDAMPTTAGMIHYSKKGVHIVPAKPIEGDK